LETCQCELKESEKDVEYYKNKYTKERIKHQEAIQKVEKYKEKLKDTLRDVETYKARSMKSDNTCIGSLNST
jgi:hypothetical protein